MLHIAVSCRCDVLTMAVMDDLSISDRAASHGYLAYTAADSLGTKNSFPTFMPTTMPESKCCVPPEIQPVILPEPVQFLTWWRVTPTPSNPACLAGNTHAFQLKNPACLAGSLHIPPDPSPEKSRSVTHGPSRSYYPPLDTTREGRFVQEGIPTEFGEQWPTPTDPGPNLLAGLLADMTRSALAWEARHGYPPVREAAASFDLNCQHPRIIWMPPHPQRGNDDDDDQGPDG